VFSALDAPLRRLGIAAAAAAVVIVSGVGVRAASGKSYFVSPAGDDGNSCGKATTAAGARKTMAAGLACLHAGDELVLRAGVYRGTLANIPDGSAAGYVTIRAEVDGEVILTGGLAMDAADHFIAIEGVRFHGPEQKSIRGNHLKIRRCEFNGGPAGGNSVNTVVGSNDSNDTADILIEDSWFHGPGGRYNLLIYNSQRVVVRRVVIRHDGGWTDGGSKDPEAGLTVYNSSNVHAQNVLVLDSNLSGYATWAAPFYNVKNNSTSHENLDNSWSGIIALNNRSIGFRTDARSGTQTFTDVVLWDNENGGMSWCCGEDSVTATINRATVGRSRVGSSGDFRGGFGNFTANGTKTLTNAIIAGLGGSDLKDVAASYFLTFGNASTAGGVGVQTVDAYAAGLKHITRIEDGSLLQSAGKDGGQIGARILNRIGADGALQGDAGWNAETTAALWPWPNEARIFREMCRAPGIIRGFCGNSSLTHYVWDYLGNGNPTTPSTADLPSAPSNIRIIR